MWDDDSRLLVGAMSSVNINGKEISCLIFDLDGTLYDAGNGYVDHIRRNIFQFMYDKNMVTLPQSAEEVWRPLFKKYNQSYKGLVSGGFSFDRDEYWKFHRSGVGDFLSTDAQLAQMLGEIPLPKFIFTNAREKEALEALVILGIESYFDKIYGADFLGDICKPEKDAFTLVLNDIGIEPCQTMFFEDSLKNVLTGAEIGMATVFVTGMTAAEEGFSPENECQIDFVVSTLTDGGAQLREKIPALFARPNPDVARE